MERLDIRPLASCGRRVYSQAEEDGITLEICARIGLDVGRFLEIGVGPGVENNTRVLADAGWGGQWIGDEKLVYQPIGIGFTHKVVTPANVEDLVRGAFNLISLDIDGNDWWIANELLRLRHQPAVWIVEYNGWQPLNRYYVMPYSASYRWGGNDRHYGASLLAWCALFDDYTLVYCTRRGVNAFFVRNDLVHWLGEQVPPPAALYRPFQRERNMGEITLEAIARAIVELRRDIMKNEGRPAVDEIDRRLAAIEASLYVLLPDAPLAGAGADPLPMTATDGGNNPDYVPPTDAGRTALGIGDIVDSVIPPADQVVLPSSPEEPAANGEVEVAQQGQVGDPSESGGSVTGLGDSLTPQSGEV